MFKVLIAKQINGTWNKVAVVNSNNLGNVSLPTKLQGQDGGYVAKKAAKHFSEDLATKQIDFLICSSNYRATKF